MGKTRRYHPELNAEPGYRLPTETGLLCPSCGKRGHADAEEADRIAARLVETRLNQRSLYRYRCSGVFGWWHLTRWPRNLEGNRNILAAAGVDKEPK